MTTRLHLYSISSWNSNELWGVRPGHGVRLWPIQVANRLHISAVVLAL